MLIKILAVVAVLAIVSYFKAKVWLNWLILIFVICCVAEFSFILTWHGNNVATKDISIYKKENATIEQQMAEIKKELLQGNMMSEERLDIILEEYQELEKRYEHNNEIIEDYVFWLENGSKNIESIIFLK